VWQRKYLSIEKGTVLQYKALSTAVVSASEYNYLNRGKFLCDSTRMRIWYNLLCVSISEEQQGSMWQYQYLNAGNGTVLSSSDEH
jgi:hypothetical protein